MPMQDREIVAGIVAGRPGGLAAAYDRYAGPLHAYCAAVLGDPSDAADAVQDTFIIAAAKVGGLRDPDRLRPWLYAVARNECRRRLRERGSSRPLEDAAELADETPAVGTRAEQEDLRALVRSALGGLNAGEREIIELSLRQELDGDDLADVLGVPRNQAHALASRARAQFSTSLGALLVARSGTQSCMSLAALLDGWDGKLTVLLRKRVNRHIERCDVCGERKRRELSPAMLLSMLPVALLPAGLRPQVLRLVADTGPAAAAHRDLAAARSGPLRPDGFPVQSGPGLRGWHRRGRPGWLAGAAALAVVIAGGAVVLAFALGGHGRPAPATLSAGHPAVAAASPGTAGVGSLPGTTGARRHHRGRPAGPTASPSTPAATAAASTPATSRRVSTPARPPASPPTTPAGTPSQSAPPPSPGTLTAAPGTVRLVPDGAHNAYQGSFMLTAAGGPVSYTISDPAPAGTLSVSPASGTLAAGQSVTITATAPYPGGPPTFVTSLTVNPGGLAVDVEYPPSG
jgi:RNA polymerase sigma factor (sigma-70 family)